MPKRRQRIIAAVAAVAVTVAAAAYIVQQALLLRSAATPDDEIRHAVAGVESGEVATIALSTWPQHLLLTPPGRRPITTGLPPEFGAYGKAVENQRAISLLVAGLKEATVPSDGRMYSPNRIIIVLRSGKMVGPFNFGAKRKVDCFSKTFVEGMREAGAKIPKQ